MAIGITFESDPLPEDFRGTLEDFRTRFLLNLRGTIPDTDILRGRIGGEKPTSNIGPWLSGDAWYAWNGTEYVPSTVKVGNAEFDITLQIGPGIPEPSSTPTDKTQIIQDKDGIIALLSDVYEGRAAIALTGTNPTIDWSKSRQFTHLLTGDTTYKVLSMKEGQQIWVLSRNTGTAYDVTWPGEVFWTGGSPTQSEDAADLYILTNVGGTILGRQLAGYP